MIDNSLIDRLEENGYLQLSRSFYSKEEIEKFEAFLDKTLKGDKEIIPKEHIDYECMGGKSCVVKYIVDYDNDIKSLINKIFTNEQIKSKLENILGKNFRVTETIMRRSMPGDEGLGLHQDAIGEHTMIINLTSTNNYHGNTIFAPKTHNLKKTLKEIFHLNGISEKLFKVLKFLLFGKFSSAGNILIFNNRVWHGRAPNFSNENSDAILVGLYPENSKINFQTNPVLDKNKDEEKNNLEIDKKRNLNINTKLIEKDSYLVLGSKNLNAEFNNKKIKSIKIIIFIMIVKIIYFIRNVFRKN